MQADICQLGMDQRKVNMLAREYCDDIKRKLKPIIISHAMLPGLLEVSCPIPIFHISTARITLDK
jgi:tyrosyl-tRNA synthetase